MADDSKQFKNILLIQTAFIGDVVLTTPMIAALRKLQPEAKITVMVNPGAAALLRSSPDVDQVMVLDKKKSHKSPLGMWRMSREIRARKFDLLLSPHQSHRTSFLAWFSGIPTRYGYSTAGMARRAYNHLLERPMDEPEIRRLLRFLDDALGPLPFEPSEQLRLHETEDSSREAAEIINDLFQPVAPILMAPSSIWPTKRWTPWRFAELAGILVETYKVPVLLVGSPADSPVAEQVVQYVNELHPAWIRDRVLNICGKTSLLGLYSLMTRSRLLVSNDSAPVHFACAAGIPVTAIFGPTVPALGYAPIAPRSIVAEKLDLDCRPCGTHGAKVCPLGHFRCMKELQAVDVMEKVKRVMA